MNGMRVDTTDHVVIAARALSKCYRLTHQSTARYATLRDAITERAKEAIGRLTGARGAMPRRDVEEEFWAVRDLSLDVRRGEVLGIIGRNGAGKSTLLKLLSRITAPTAGQIRIEGRVASLLEVGTGFHPELTGRENIFLNGAILGMHRAEIRRKFDEIVAFAEVERFLDTPVKRYSSGMYVRLAFAIAAHLEPEILIVDEVLAVGDAEFQRRCLGKMNDVATQSGRTVLFVSHNMSAVRALCSTVLWMDHGTVAMHGSCRDVSDAYLRAMLDPAEASINLDAARRNGADGERLRLKRLEFNDGRPVRHGEPLSVRIEYETRTPVPEAAFGVGFSTLDGARIMTLDTDLECAPMPLPAAHKGVVEAEVDVLHLQPGRYGLDVGARSGTNNSLDYVPNCAQLEILPGATTPPVIIRETGGVRVPARWRWDSLMEASIVGDDVPSVGEPVSLCE
jgi:lipopolysaccharide transport system ATP-binding protein